MKKLQVATVATLPSSFLFRQNRSCGKTSEAVTLAGLFCRSHWTVFRLSPDFFTKSACKQFGVYQFINQKASFGTKEQSHMFFIVFSERCLLEKRCRSKKVVRLLSLQVYASVVIDRERYVAGQAAIL
jgi:hypothetical protein